MKGQIGKLDEDIIFEDNIYKEENWKVFLIKRNMKYNFIVIWYADWRYFCKRRISKRMIIDDLDAEKKIYLHILFYLLYLQVEEYLMMGMAMYFLQRNMKRLFEDDQRDFIFFYKGRLKILLLKTFNKDEDLQNMKLNRRDILLKRRKWK